MCTNFKRFRKPPLLSPNVGLDLDLDRDGNSFVKNARGWSRVAQFRDRHFSIQWQKELG